MFLSQTVSYVFHKFVLRFFVARTVTLKEMNGLFTSLIRHEYFAGVRMLYRVICGCLSAATSANYPLQHPHISILPPADMHSDVDNADACCMIFCGRFAIQLGRFVVFVRVIQYLWPISPMQCFYGPLWH